MNNLLHVEYGQTGRSSGLNSMGMREMQARAFAERNSQYLLIKAPPASGKSRALMFLGLDKLENQSVRKVIVAVPEKSIGGSFQETNLTEQGFFADWRVTSENNLCVDGGEAGKVQAFQRFMHGNERILICTHATLRFAFDKLVVTDFDNCLVAIDEFHHVSADGDNRLGNLIDELIKKSSAHIVAMTGSYFRGDTVPILLPEDEALFTKVTYTYYEQLNGYQYLKSLGIGYHFYQGRYIDALPTVLDTSKKTIIHIPNVNSGESTKDKYGEVDAILDVIGSVIKRDPLTGVYHIAGKNGCELKLANLVDDNPNERPKIQAYLRNIKAVDDMDIIIALGMAKEGFDWPYCEHVLTIGYRSSLTEIVQIIGRATRDCTGKTHAQFTNLIAQPDAQDDDVKASVNNMLKAITTSLLMEQILAPNIQFKPRSQWDGQPLPPNTLLVDDSATLPVSPKVLDILNSDKNEIMATLMANEQLVKETISETIPPETFTQVALPAVIQTLYPDLTDEEQEQVRIGVLQSMLITQKGGVVDWEDLPQDANVDMANGAEEESVNSVAGKQFLKMGEKFICIDNLDIDLIDAVNPFHGAYEILSKSVTAPMLKTIQEAVSASRSQVSEEEAIILWPKIKQFTREQQREPSLNASDPIEKRYAEALAFIRKMKQQKLANQEQ
ncbi:putative ATP-dependent helicase YeeB [Pectobacterium carotovorum subsp. carotovorum]|uniref:DEAD/DEAH box helicase n=1 Tax=Pectobacterium versatile TaxID=2488639 RepID=A0ABU8K002_9GAMM|nr:DEAD/DEAH box helicase [Pectobacterium versatile]ASN86841.1 ATP-dependent helicase [Pectobacterium versatile]UCP80808.1 ATP-dependent helicase [Pectobacterium versatile]GKW32867.1 putative ATP-dependent helicase YeeB [Pectobacterium carotovorum subsp. carotovorum]